MGKRGEGWGEKKWREGGESEHNVGGREGGREEESEGEREGGSDRG